MGRRCGLEVATERLVDGTILQVGRTTLERERFLRDVRALLSALLAIVVVVGLVGGGALTWQAFRPVRELLDTLRHITHTGRLDARVPVGDEGDVLSELGRVSNAMLARIELLVTGMRNALDAVAHDLRTPIARLRGRAEQALLAPPDVDRYRDALEDTVEEADRVSSLLTTLMDISEAEAGTMQLRREPVDVARVLQETLDLYEDLAEARGVQLDDRPAASRPDRQCRLPAPAPGAGQSRRQRGEIHPGRRRRSPSARNHGPTRWRCSCGIPVPVLPSSSRSESGSGCIAARRARRNAALGLASAWCVPSWRPTAGARKCRVRRARAARSRWCFLPERLHHRDFVAVDEDAAPDLGVVADEIAIVRAVLRPVSTCRPARV